MLFDICYSHSIRQVIFVKKKRSQKFVLTTNGDKERIWKAIEGRESRAARGKARQREDREGEVMKRFLDGVLKINEVMQATAGIFLTFIMLLTTVDVIGRIFGKPVPGAVEIIAICGGVVVGFTVPITSWMRGHIAVDFVLNWLPDKAKNLVNIITRCIGIGLCLLISWNSTKIGAEFRQGAEVSGTLQLPLYPIAYALAACFFVLSIVFLCDILKILGGTYE